jgi:hypothetical protein
VNTNHKKKDTE